MNAPSVPGPGLKMALALESEKRSAQLALLVVRLAEVIFTAQYPHTEACSLPQNGVCSCGAKPAIDAYRKLLSGSGFPRFCGLCFYWRRLSYSNSGGLVQPGEEGVLGSCSHEFSPLEKNSDGHPVAATWYFSCPLWALLPSRDVDFNQLV